MDYLAGVNENSEFARPHEVRVGPLQLHAPGITSENAHYCLGDLLDFGKTRQVGFLAGQVFLPERLSEGDTEGHVEIPARSDHSLINLILAAVELGPVYCSILSSMLLLCFCNRSLIGHTWRPCHPSKSDISPILSVRSCHFLHQPIPRSLPLILEYLKQSLKSDLSLPRYSAIFRFKTRAKSLRRPNMAPSDIAMMMMMMLMLNQLNFIVRDGHGEYLQNSDAIQSLFAETTKSI